MTPSAATAPILSKNFRATHVSNDCARIRMSRIALRGGRYGACALTSLAAAEATLTPAERNARFPRAAAFAQQVWRASSDGGRREFSLRLQRHEQRALRFIRET
jgi:hypothetical protein